MSSTSEEEFKPSVKKVKKSAGGRGRKKKESVSKRATSQSTPRRRKIQKPSQADITPPVSKSKRASSRQSKSKEYLAVEPSGQELNESTDGGSVSEMNKEEEKEMSLLDVESDSDHDSSFSTAKSKAKSTKQKKEKPKKGKKDAGGGADEAKETVLKYMKAQNRPYSLQVVFDNLHGKIKKPLVQKLLDQLVEEGELQDKDFGKAKIYLYNQANISDFDKSTIDNLNQNLNELKEQTNSIKEEINELKGSVKSYQAQLTNDELEKEIEKYEQLNFEASEKLATYMSDDYPKLDDADIEKAENSVKVYDKAARQRKKMCKNLLNAIADMTGLKMSAVLTQVGIEED